MAVVNQLANKRQVTQKAKTRSEVSEWRKEKPWRQKGQVIQNRVLGDLTVDVTEGVFHRLQEIIHSR